MDAFFLKIIQEIEHPLEAVLFHQLLAISEIAAH